MLTILKGIQSKVNSSHSQSLIYPSTHHLEMVAADWKWNKSNDHDCVNRILYTGYNKNPNKMYCARLLWNVEAELHPSLSQAHSIVSLEAPYMCRHPVQWDLPQSREVTFDTEIENLTL